MSKKKKTRDTQKNHFGEEKEKREVSWGESIGGREISLGQEKGGC